MKIKIPKPHGADWIAVGVIGLMVATLGAFGAVTIANTITAEAASETPPSPSTTPSWTPDPDYVLVPVTDPALLPIDPVTVAVWEQGIVPSEPSTEPTTDPSAGGTPGGTTGGTPGGTTGGVNPGGGTTPTEPPPPPPPPFEPWQTNTYYEGSSSQFCAALDTARQGAGAVPFASCSRSQALVDHAEAMARANSIWHSGYDSIVGTDTSIQGLVNAFMASSSHRNMIVGDGSAATATVGCYWWEQNGQTAENLPPYTIKFVYCAGAFVYP